MSKILLVVDNSNIHVTAKEKHGQDARFSYEKFEKEFYSKDSFVAKQITGSTPPSTDAFWGYMERNGYKVITYERKRDLFGKSKEKGVDTAIGIRATEAIIDLEPEILVLFSGDLDMKPLVEIAKERSCIIHLWSFRESSSSDLEKECDKIFYIDEYESILIYFQNRQGHIESYAEHNERIANEKRIAQEEWMKRKEDEERDNNERFPTWGKVVLGGGAVVAVGLAIKKFIFRR